eukprot:14710481-Ditylum_brightwellii.AAC.1
MIQELKEKDLRNAEQEADMHVEMINGGGFRLFGGAAPAPPGGGMFGAPASASSPGGPFGAPAPAPP